MLEAGERVHIITRRLFPEDIRRHFVGEVVTFREPLLLVAGYVFIYDPMTGGWVKRADRRTRIFAVADSGLIIHVIPRDTVLEDVVYETIEGQLVVTDHGSFRMNIGEFGATR